MFDKEDFGADLFDNDFEDDEDLDDDESWSKSGGSKSFKSVNDIWSSDDAGFDSKDAWKSGGKSGSFDFGGSDMFQDSFYSRGGQKQEFGNSNYFDEGFGGFGARGAFFGW